MASLLLDFDGVFIDTTTFKRDAFIKSAQMLSPELAPELLTQLKNSLMGADREEIAHWYSLRQTKFDPDLAQRKFLEGYSEIVKDGLCQFEMSDSERQVILGPLSCAHKLWIVSKAPRVEILAALDRLRLPIHLFQTIFGSCDKSRVIGELLKTRATIQAATIFVGDMPSDLKAAEENKIRFIRFESTIGNEFIWDDNQLKVSKFEQLATVLESL